jgi:hypothetical protein
MFSLRMSLSDTDKMPAADGSDFAVGEGRIEAFKSLHIVGSSDDRDGRRSIWFGEDKDPFAERTIEPAGRNEYTAFIDYSGVKIALIGAPGQKRIAISRTAAGGWPLYVAVAGEEIAASWRFEQAVEVLERPRPNVQACRFFLEFNGVYTRDQVIEGVYMLWPGESLEFGDDGLTFHKGEHDNVVTPSTLTSDARATDEFLFLIADALRLNLERSRNPVVELSGGFDSSCVALAARSIRPDLNSHGLIQEGAVGRQQTARRDELIALLQVRDSTYPAGADPPFAALATVAECSFTPFDDIYRMQSVRGVENHPAFPFDLLITGLGGDELTKEDTFLRGSLELGGNIPTSSMTAAVGRCDMFMRRGIWVAHPLVAQPIVDFCRALPAKMREKRLLNVLTLARSGLSDGFLFPRYYEHYGSLIQREASLFDFDVPLRESLVADYGLGDLSTLLHEAREGTLMGLDHPLITRLWLHMKLEMVLRRYVR